MDPLQPQLDYLTVLMLKNNKKIRPSAFLGILNCWTLVLSGL